MLRDENPLPMHPPLATLDDDAWEDLLNFIEERRVIPIIGPELLTVETETGPRLLYDWIAEKLAAKLSVDTAQLPQPYTLNDVVCWFLSSRGRREEAYTRLRSILRDANFAPPLALRQLAQITDFDLFVTTTFDPLLEQAINAERFGGAQSTEVIAYAPNRVADLPTEREQLQRPVVYHLLGRLSASPTYVISDEDTLEFICALQSEHLTPEKLFHELEHNHLLFIGSSFTNWLARLFLRMAKRHRLSDPRDVGEVLADNHSGRDGRLMAFLQQVSVRTRIYSGAEKFVDELHRRWTARSKPGEVIPLRRGAAALPAARARDARQRRVHQLCARGPARGAEDEGRVSTPPASRPGSTSSASKAATTTTARSSATSRAARSSSRSSRPPPSAGSKATSAASGATRSIARATSPTARCSSCRCASTTRTAATRRCRTNSRPCISRGCPGGEVTPEFARRARRTCSRRRAHRHELDAAADTAGRPTPRLACRRRRAPVARPRVVHRGDARATSTGAKRKSPSSAAACSASCSRSCSASRASARRRSCARASFRGCGPRATARSTCASTIRPIRRRPSEQIKQAIFRATQAAGAVDAARRRRSQASRCGSSCTTATTSCATRPARRSSRC